MKVSKVKHRRTAVSVNKKNNTVKGILYDDPIKKDSKGDGASAYVSTKYVVDDVVRNSSRLYSPFNSKKLIIDDKTKVVANSLRQHFKNFVKIYLNCESIDEQQMKFTPDNKYLMDNRVRISLPSDVNEEKLVEAIVNSSLRKSLNKKCNIQIKAGLRETFDIPELIKKAIKIYCIDEKRNLNDAEKLDMYALFSFMYEDKYKNRQKKLIINSISNQVTKVKVCENGNRLLKLSIADTKKKPVWDFMIEYSNSDKKKQDTMLRNIRKSIVLFVCGVENYKNIENDNKLDICSWDGYDINENQQFVCVNTNNSNDDYFISSTELRRANLDHYMKAVAKLNDDRNKFWFQHFESVIETFFSKKAKRNIERIKSAYLCEYLWRDFCSYVALKYVDLGKGVYHFTMADKLALINRNKYEKSIIFGEIESRYNNGISSFDYERIKAEELFERNISTYTTFATNIFSKAVVQDDYIKNHNKASDVLQYSDKEFSDSKVLRNDAMKRILQYWGGQSRWNNTLNKINVDTLCIDIKEHLSNIRNSSVHYTSKVSLSGDKNESIVYMLFKKDFAEIRNIFASKYYSNNVWMFYSIEKINGLMEYLYGDNSTVIDAQIPAYNNIIKRKNIADVIEKIIKKNSYKTINELELIKKYRACLYFILKEIYYNRFIKQENLKEQFIQFVDNDNNLLDDNKNAVESFRRRIHDIDNSLMSFGEMCQFIMTDYNMQNQGNKSIKSKDRQNEDKKKGIDGSYKHFPLLLYHVIKELFLKYIKTDEKIVFIREPANIGSVKTQDEFETHISTLGLYKTLKEKVDSNMSLLDWYTLSHFLMPKQLNYLIGDIKNYIQYLRNIDKRAESVGNNKAYDIDGKINNYYDIVYVLDFSLQYIGRISNEITDYFADEDEYALFMSQFVDFSSDNIVGLKTFCNEKTSNGKHTIGLYCDGANPIMNRNIAYAKMYSNDKILSRTYSKVTIKEIERYYRIQDDLKNVFENGVCKNKDQQKELCDFQKIKNHIELTEISIYTNILNDFMSQFISWSYLRERDLMYFQLGMHYLRLYYGTNELETKYNKLVGESVNIEKGALLYQIAAMYTYKLPIYKVDKNGSAVLAEKQGGTGASVTSFVTEYCKENMRDAIIYEKGLELFEDVKQHKKWSDFRNDIAHMRYISDRDKSIMDIISEIYGGFFTYDIKLKKSIPVIFKNILMRYAVDANLNFLHKENRKLKDTLINIRADKGLVSDKYTYKIGEKDTVDIEVRNDKFLLQLRKLLEYKIRVNGNVL